MIKVIITRTAKIVERLEIKGHSNSAPYGQDLVCAAVSAVAVGGANALLSEDPSLNVLMSEGHLVIDDIKRNQPDQSIIKTIIAQLQTIANDNQKYVKITFITN